MTALDSSVAVSVVVPTRNRPSHAVECARELVRCSSAHEIIFVDQSDDDSTCIALEAIGDPRIRCVRSALRGAANGRNVGIDVSKGEVIAFTDDDCRVAPDWVERIADIFRTGAEVAVVCGRVHVPEELQKQGFAMAFEPERRSWSGAFPPPGRDWGITANFAGRRSAFERVGKFDAFLGTGAPLLAGEEPDILFRVLAAGLTVINASEVEVTHLGIRRFGRDAGRLWHAYAVGTAAALTKHIRLGEPAAARIYFGYLGQSVAKVARNVVKRERPTGVGYVLGFLSGTLMSLRFRIRPADHLYEARSGASAAVQP